MKFILILLISNITLASDKIQLPNDKLKQELFNKVVTEINRLDGEGLIPRSNRPENWKETTQRLENELLYANDLFSLGRVFKRLNASYPNLHAKVYLKDELDPNISDGRIIFPFKIQPDLIKNQLDKYNYFIVQNDKSSPFLDGDQIISINNLLISEIEKENFIFCKFPLFSQCALELDTNLRNEVLNWNRSQQLDFKILRKKIEYNISVQFKKVLPENEQFEIDPSCENQESRYKNFKLDYKGFKLCAYKSKIFKNTTVLRIINFQYAPDDPITDIEQEVEMFWFNYWKKESKNIKELIVDVIGNYGGQSPISYYALFTNKPYQEQYVQFKKIKEFEDSNLLNSIFWNEKSKFKWFEKIKINSFYDEISENDFLPQVPQFCANQNKPCDEENFLPKPHSFNGKVKILVDQWCVSSCVGFIDNMKKLLGEKVSFFGHEDSADSAYSRLTLAASFIDDKINLEVQPLKKAKKPDLPISWVRQIVSITRSTDKDGHVLSGKPQKINYWIDRKWSESNEEWAKKVFNIALKK